MHNPSSIDRYRIKIASWGVKIETGEIESFLGQEIIMAFSQAFLDWEEATEAKGISIGEQRGISIGEQRGISIGKQRGISIDKLVFCPQNFDRKLNNYQSSNLMH